MQDRSSSHTVAIGGGDTATPLNLEKRLAIIERYLPCGRVRVLDLGCGSGDYVRALNRIERVAAWGVEYEIGKVTVAANRPDLRGRVVRGDIEHLPFADRSFDVVLLNEVIEHVPNDARALSEIRRALTPEGRLLLFAPNRWFPFETHGVRTQRGELVGANVPFLPWLPTAIGRRCFRYWARNYWPHELQRLVREARFDVLATGFVWQTFENISGRQPALIRTARPALRAVAATLETTPGLRRFGVSQLIVARPR
jgi:SAM-dependent methyltransferase